MFQLICFSLHLMHIHLYSHLHQKYQTHTHTHIWLVFLRLLCIMKHPPPFTIKLIQFKIKLFRLNTHYQSSFPFVTIFMEMCPFVFGLLIEKKTLIFDLIAVICSNQKKELILAIFLLLLVPFLWLAE